MRTWSKRKVYKNLFPWAECKLNWVSAEQPLLTSTQIIEKARFSRLKVWIGICKKISKATSSHKSTYFKASNIDREKYGSWWILTNSEVPAAKREVQGVGHVMIWAGVFNQTISGLFKVNEGVKLNSANYCNFIDKTFLEWYKSQSHSFKMKCIFRLCTLLLMHLILGENSLTVKIY